MKIFCTFLFVVFQGSIWAGCNPSGFQTVADFIRRKNLVDIQTSIHNNPFHRTPDLELLAIERALEHADEGLVRRAKEYIWSKGYNISSGFNPNILKDPAIREEILKVAGSKGFDLENTKKEIAEEKRQEEQRKNKQKSYDDEVIMLEKEVKKLMDNDQTSASIKNLLQNSKDSMGLETDDIGQILKHLKDHQPSVFYGLKQAIEEAVSKQPLVVASSNDQYLEVTSRAPAFKALSPQFEEAQIKHIVESLDRPGNIGFHHVLKGNSSETGNKHIALSEVTNGENAKALLTLVVDKEKKTALLKSIIVKDGVTNIEFASMIKEAERQLRNEGVKTIRYESSISADKDRGLLNYLGFEKEGAKTYVLHFPD